MKKTLIVRYLRLGDAILVLPLIYDLALKYPNDTFVVLFNSKLDVLFGLMSSNVKFIGMVYKRPKAFLRALRHKVDKHILLLRLAFMNFDNIVFLQAESFEVLASRLFRKFGVNVIKSQKPDFDSKKRLSLKCNDGITIVDLHKEKLAQLGYTGLVPRFDSSKLRDQNNSALYQKLAIDKNKKLLAIAPFSFQEDKAYPLDKMEEVILYFSGKEDYFQILILGGGDHEKKIADCWTDKYPSVINLVNRVSFREEVFIISQCKLVLTMDSANLHLASLLNIPVVSIWGATTPKCGYYPEKEDLDRAIVKGLNCQPCSLWGGSSCPSNAIKYSCLDISPEVVIKKIEEVLLQQN